MAHKVFLFFLLVVGASAVISMAAMGWEYYLTPIHLRPFRADYDAMKPTGHYSQGLGIIGATMIIIGVSTYSSRKRVKSLRDLGKMSAWLQFHIFMCLLGPILVIFHTTFKAGGVAAISLWTMLSVWLSGMIGRFLYAQIPRNVAGAELDVSQIQGELDRLGSELARTPTGTELVKQIDEGFAAIKSPENLSQVLSVFLHLRTIRRRVNSSIRRLIAQSALTHQQAHALKNAARSRAALMQKTLVLTQVGKLFHYWHAVHLPFTIIMFITLAAHVVAAVLLGYTWIF
jgi:hypothetical protein